jgi:hypothetical protein
MQLKHVFRQQPADHHIFLCGYCSLEYPVVAQQALAGLATDESSG